MVKSILFGGSGAIQKAVILFTTIVLAVPAYADVDKVNKEADEVIAKGADLLNDLDTYFRYVPYSDAEKMSGKVGLIEAGGELSHSFRILGKMPLDIAVNVDYINIDKTVEVPLPVSLSNIGLDIETRLPLFNIPNTYAAAGINPSFANDGFSFDPDGLFFPTRFYLIYAPNDTFVIAAGAEFFTDFDNQVQPIGGVIYKPNDRLTFNIVTDDIFISYKLADKIEILAETDYKLYDQYKVSRQGNNNVLLYYSYISAGGGINFRPSANTCVSLSAGGVFDRRIEYPDAGGKIDIEGGIYIQCKGGASF